MAYVAVHIGVPDEAAARELSRTLVEERLAAGTRTASGTSHYRWEGTVHERTYWTITAYTTTDQLDDLYERAERDHDDDLPGITHTEIDATEEYLRWIDAETA